MKKNKIIIVIIIVLVLLIAGILLLPKLFGGASKEKTLEKLTKEFYTLYYEEHSKDKDIKEFLSNYKDTGLKINLGDVETYINGKSESERDYSVFDKCDLNKTYSKIYPLSPFGENDVKVEVYLSCEK